MKKIVTKSKEPIDGYMLLQVIKYTNYETGFHEVKFVFVKI